MTVAKGSSEQLYLSDAQTEAGFWECRISRVVVRFTDGRGWRVRLCSMGGRERDSDGDGDEDGGESYGEC